MLKRLELIGFKSFADKTQFDFSTGITAIVGPNGSGKSNIVDAVRWVLGEQSAKSLRGGEMADVIFNGSTSRRSFGMAEVTMTFDNSRRVLLTDVDEVQITRRVYRDGEGEYLINHQLSRLKDIRELFLGSGAGAEAYCVIEQGRVDVLLQASTKDRRSIFEEAAGISRFKAKKIETVRKLERVDQNLQRVHDIIDEVEKQLRSVKLQAAKAQRHQEYTNRLRQLRVTSGLQEYHQLVGRLEMETAVLDRLRAGLEHESVQLESLEAETQRLEEALTRLEESGREQETLLAQAGQQIATEETTLARERSLAADLEADLTRMRAQMTELNARVAALTGAADQVAEQLDGVETQCQTQRRGLRGLEEEHHVAVVRLAELHQQVEADKADHLDQMRQAARLQNDTVSYKAQVDNMRRERERLRLKTEQVAEHLASVDVELTELTEAQETLQAKLAAVRRTLAGQRQERERLRRLTDETHQSVADLRAQRSGLVSRIEVLEGLERSQEGLGTGVREVLALIGQADPGPWRTVLGIVADFLTVRREYAPLIDVALGQRAQRFLVRDAALLGEALRQRARPFSGRVSFLPLAPSVSENGAVHADRLFELSKWGRERMASTRAGVPAHPGIVALAEQLVTCAKPELADVPALLLGHTLVVRDLSAARGIAAYASGYRFVTLQGELLEADGTITVGTHHAETGILSRKSELRELREQAIGLDRRIDEVEHHLADLRDRVAALDSQAGVLQQETDVLAEEGGDLRSRIGQHHQRREGLHEEVVLSRSEISGVEQEIQNLETAWQLARSQAEAAEQRARALQARMEHADQEIRLHEQQRQQRQQECTSAKVALAQIEERLAALRAKHSQIEGDREQRRQEQLQGEEQLTATHSRLVESQATMLRASAALAHHFLDKESAEHHLSRLEKEREEHRHERQSVTERVQVARSAWQAQQEQAHARELEVSDLRHRRDSLVQRLREDYQLELAELYRQQLRIEDQGPRIEEETGGIEVSPPLSAEPRGMDPLSSVLDSPSSMESRAAEEEIAELRRKLSRLGSVNLDSLQELAELETRAHSLRTQFDDLSAAKNSLEEIIAKINQDSRRFFLETFSNIRTHFQELFRKLFGGGMADVLLEDENDILESGIEIIARPPGKELRSISLMSGGEKTLTAVALLLAIFRSRPSPFCILDEVDAALDEANIGRFTAVLREFLDRSHFIIITHSKRTMAVADVLYGVTMQESGVSKRVAVRFEDWPEDGEPAATAADAGVRNGQEGFEPPHSLRPPALDHAAQQQ